MEVKLFHFTARRVCHCSEIPPFKFGSLFQDIFCSIKYYALSPVSLVRPLIPSATCVNSFTHASIHLLLVAPHLV